MSNNALLYDMMAYRINFEYHIVHERDMIREFKIYLSSNNVESEYINDIITEFYEYFNIELQPGLVENTHIEIYYFTNTINNFNIDEHIVNNSQNRNENNIEIMANSIRLINLMMSYHDENNDYEFKDVIVTVNNKDINNLKKNVLIEDLEEECSICLSKMVTTEEIINLDCNHKYHSKCILKYLQEYNYKCPICRKNVGVYEHNIIDN